MTPPTTRRPIDPDALSLAAIRDGLLAGRPVTVLGLARTGVALARFLGDAGAEVTVYDGRPAAELGPAIEALGSRPVTLALGPDVDPVATWRDAALVTTSPSITPDFPTTEPRLRAALQDLVARRAAGEASAPALLSEPDLALRLCLAPTIGVTGTKGKTTTASLSHAILAADPAHPAVLGGNIGTPLIDRLWDVTPDHRVVIELSELQLPSLSRGTTVAVYTNVTSDHLDRHGSLEAYRRVKRRLAELVDRDGAVDPQRRRPGRGGLRRGEPGSRGPLHAWPSDARRARDRRRLDRRRGRRAPVGARRGVDAGGGWPHRGGRDPRDPRAAQRLECPGGDRRRGPRSGVPRQAIAGAVAGFHGVEHRLQTIATIDGVRFVNDSQGTQPDAVIAALRAFDGPIVLIAGGRDKGVDLSALAPVVAERAVAAVLIGESGPRLEADFRAAGLARTERAVTLEEAVERADVLAREARTAAGEAGAAGVGVGQAGSETTATVLLSPAAASFDMFVDYAARGRAFIAAVDDLAARTTDRGGTR